MRVFLSIQLVKVRTSHMNGAKLTLDTFSTVSEEVQKTIKVIAKRITKLFK